MTTVSATLIAREMRSAARHPLTYNLRTFSAAALLAVSAVSIAEGGSDADWGARVYPHLHAALMGAIWVLVPLLTADCISRERRERTLPLLFLTPLNSWQIVQAKGLANGLRAFTLWLAVLPVLTIAFMAGGVSWQDVVLSLLVSFGSICLAMAAGLLASALTRVWMRALSLSALLSFLFFFGYVLGISLLIQGDGLEWALDGDGVWRTDARFFWAGGFSLGYAPSPVSRAVNWALFVKFGFVALSGLVTLKLVIQIAAAHLNRTWQETPPPESVLRLQRRLTTPLYFTSLFKRWMHWELNRNPIGWLERRSWSARLVTWSWLAVFVCIYSSLLLNPLVYHRAFNSVQSLMAWLLILAVGASSAGSFRRERETGVLELLLVSPLSEWQIIGGRLRGVWMQFMPAILLLVGCWLYLMGSMGGASDPCRVLFYGATLATLPVFGLYYSLAVSTFPAAFLGSLFLAVALPVGLVHMDDLFNFVRELFGQFYPQLEFDIDKSVLAATLQLGLAGVCAWRLHRDLKRRKFALQP